ncbi:MAG: hypothetical protein WA766_11780 [Candidatus Acidiferrales bacterium]
MFNPTFDTTQTSQILLNRLARLQNTLRAFVGYTQVDYQSEVYSVVNGVLNLGNNMTPALTISGGTPAIIGNIETNLDNLNNDAQDIAAELIAIENQLAQYYNLTAGVQNTLRQSIREQVFASTSSQWLEAFVNDQQLQSGYTTSIDFDAGVATSTLSNDTVVTPNNIVVGPSSISSTPTANAAYNPLQLLNPTGVITNLVSWSGSQLELQIVFFTPTPVNRLILHMDNYNGLEITSLVSSPDGIYFDEIDLELLPTDLALNAQSGKFSGDAIIDFNPRNVSVMKLVIQDEIGQGFIALRGIELHQRIYASAGQLTSNPITTPSGNVLFNPTQRIYNQLTSIVHQLSYDGANFQVITPGQIIALTNSPFWYRAQLNTNASAFTSAASPLVQPPGDPNLSANYTIASITTVALNAGVSQRNLAFTSVTGAITLNETPIAGTLSVYYGSVLQTPSVYTFTNNVLTLDTLPQSSVTVRYQVSALGSTGLGALQQYFSPYLISASFEAV